MPAVGAFLGGILGTVAPAIGSATFGAYVAGAGFASSIAGKLLTSVALSALSAALAPDIKAPQQPGIKTEVTQTGGMNYASFVVGRAATGGTFVCPPMTHGQVGDIPNAYLTYVIEIADLPGHALTGIILDGERIPMDGDTEDYGQAVDDGKYAGRVWWRYFDGTQTTADARLITDYGDYPERPWESDMVGAGICYAVLTFRYDRDVFSGFPQARFEVEGVPLYDPRADTTAGGDGAQRWNDPSTWARSENFAVQAHQIMRGVDFGGPVWGGQIAQDALPLATWTTQMTVCDTQNGAGNPQYRTGLEITVDRTPADVLEELAKGAAAEYAELGGVFKLRCGAPGLPVYFMDDSDLVLSEAVRMQLMPEPRSRAVSATFPDPAALWEPVEAPLAIAGDDDVVPSEIATLSLTPVPYWGQVQRLQQAYLKDQERRRVVTIPLPPDASLLEPLDVIEWTSEWFGLTAKDFEVRSIEVDSATGLTIVGLREKEASDFDDSAFSEVPAPDVSPTPVAPAVVVLPGFDADGVEVEVDGVGRRPGIQLSWSANLSGLRSVAWQLRVAGETQLLSGSVDVPGGTSVIVTEGIVAGVTYQARARAVLNRPTDWTDWVTVAAPDVRLSASDLADALQDRIDTAFERTDADVADATGTIGVLRDRIEGYLGGIGLDGGPAPLNPLDRIVALEIPNIRSARETAIEAEDKAILAAIENFGLRQRLTDAGIYVDPDTGSVKIRAIDALAGRQSNVEINLDALESEISLKASFAYVNQAVSEAVLDPSQIPVLGDIEARINDAEILIDAQDGQIELVTNSLTVEDEIVTMGSVTQRLDSVEGSWSLTLTQSTFEDLQSTVSDVSIDLNALDRPGIAFSVSTSRALRDQSPLDEDARVIDMIRSWQGEQAVREVAASGRRAITAYIDDNNNAIAQEVAELAAVQEDTSALFREDVKVLAGEDAALASRTSDLEVQVQTDGTGLLARVSSLEEVVIDEDGIRGIFGQELTGSLAPEGEIWDAIDTAADNAVGAAVGRVASFDIDSESALALFRDQATAALDDGEGNILGANVLSGAVAGVEDNANGLSALSARAGIIESSIGSQNLVPNGRVDTGSFARWGFPLPDNDGVVPATFTIGVRGAGPAILNAGPTPFAVRIAADAAAQTATAATVPVTEGDVIRLSARAARVSTGSGTIRMQAVFDDADGTTVGVTAYTVTPTNAWVLYDGFPGITAPAGSARMRVRLIRDGGGAGDFFVTDFRAEREAEGVKDVSARVSTIEGAYVDEAGALAFVNQQISAEYGDITALAEATSFAEATINGITEGFVWKLGGSDVLSLVRVDDGETAPVTTARLRSDLIRLDGDTEVTGSFVVSGAQVVLNADTQVNGDFRVSGSLVVEGTLDTGQMADNAVTDFAIAGSGSVANNSSTWTTVAEFTISANDDAQALLGLLVVTLNDAPNLFPATFELRATINSTITALSLTRQEFIQASGSGARFVGSLSRAFSSDTATIRLQIRNAGGLGVSSSNMWGMLVKR